MRNTIASWTVLLGLAVAAGAAKPENPVDVVAALVEKPPAVLSELEKIAGPLHRDPAKWEDAVGPLHRISPGPAVARADVELAIDPFHQDPREVRDPSLEQWDLDFVAGRDACRRLLEKRFPRPHVLRAAGRRVLRFGDFYFSDLDVEDGFRLSWYRSEPLFAIPERSAKQIANLVDDLAAVANAGFSRQAIAARLGPLVYDSALGLDALHGDTWTLQYKPAGAAKPERFTISFKRPLPSRDLLPKLGIQNPAVRSGDVHMQSRTLFDRAKRLSMETGYPLPAVKGYVVSIHVDPEGLVEIDKAPGSPIWSAEGSQILSLSAFLPQR
ncbi:MAG TPA: hypothetical protein VGX68_18295 [Thermoanaerobaculia bacterium]|jgi:hypothetical protein|nr:hypothetical protein [Thermoanaerobaculia bacterium]